MSYLPIIGFLIAAVAAVIYFRPQKHGISRYLKKGQTCAQDFQALYQVLADRGNEGDYWVVLIPETQGDDQMSVNIQFSKEDETVGLDWVLNCQANKDYKKSFTSFARSKGYNTRINNQQDVSFIRVEGENLSQLACDYILEKFNLTPMTPLELIVSDYTLYKS